MSRMRDRFLYPNAKSFGDGESQTEPPYMYDKAEIWTKREGRFEYTGFVSASSLSFGSIFPRIELTQPLGLKNLIYDSNTIFHRVDGPAIILSGGARDLVKIHYLNGQLHNETGPARLILGENDFPIVEEWRRHGYLHRDGGPAVTMRTGLSSVHCHWFWKGYLHRVDGPARTTGVCLADLNKIDTSGGWFLESAHVPCFFEILKAGSVEDKAKVYAQYCQDVWNNSGLSRFLRKRIVMLVGKHVLNNRRLAKLVKLAAQFGQVGEEKCI